MEKHLPAFTLLEILIVMVVIGIIATIAAPRLTRKDPSTKWENVLEEINNMVSYARQEAISRQKTYRLRFKINKSSADFVQIEEENTDPENPNKKIYPLIQAHGFKPIYKLSNSEKVSIKFEAIYHGKTEQLSENKGEAYCYIIPNGLVQEILIHAIRTEDNKTNKASFKMQPFFGKFEKFDGFLKPEK